MGKEVLVTVIGTQTSEEGEEATITLITRGSYFQKKSSYYIVYRESEASGMQGATTSIKAESDRVTLNRMGTSEFRQVFERGMHNQGKYVTPYGAMDIRVLPWKVQVDLTEGGGSIDLEYEIEASAQKLGYNRLNITVTEV